MVSGTRCPAGSDPVMKWSESRAAAPKGRCPVEHRGEFPDVRPSVRPSFHPPPVGHQDLKSALPALNLTFEASNQPSRLIIRAYLKAGGQNQGLESSFQVLRANLSHKGLV